MSSIRRWIWLFAGALLVATPAWAQEYRGRVQGTLTDEAQLALPGAQVTLRNDATGVAVARTTGPEGRYLFDYVDPGTYTLTAELERLHDRRAAQRARPGARRRHGRRHDESRRRQPKP